MSALQQVGHPGRCAVNMKEPLLLIIMDGWGLSPDIEGNAVALAKTPVIDKLSNIYPVTELGASGLSVGLPEGQMGNSEVGHLNLGAGRVVYQDYTRINKAISDGSLSAIPALSQVAEEVKENKTALHLMGLLSDGGVHSHINHLFSLIDFAKEIGVAKLFIHVFLDGRDTPPRSGKGYVGQLESYLAKSGIGKIATVSGRYYAMDRDGRWDRVREAYLAMTGGGKRRACSAISAVESSYSEDKGDEFVPPTVIVENGREPPRIKGGDSVIFFNFRADRAREITRAFTEPRFNVFAGLERPEISTFVCMTEYNEAFGLPLAFPPLSMERLFGGIVSDAGLRQLRIAETEKYAHVTFFFNGGEERSFPGEERILIPSPTDVPTYDLRPRMSAPMVTEKVIAAMSGSTFDVIILNYANADMVGHTGILPAATEAVETVDACIGKVMTEAENRGWRVLITSDHGNAEQMTDKKTGEPHTAHTSNPVPFILCDKNMKGRRLRPGILADIAPTMLDLIGIDKPEEMDGRSLLL